MPPLTTRNELPEVVIDPNSQREYIRGKFLGKGSYAECYEFMDKLTNVVYAGKITFKQRLDTPRTKEYMKEEINIHSTLHHANIVGFHSYFEDDTYVYIILELCTRQSLKEVLRDRKTLSEAEVRYFMQQLLLACDYMVQQRVLHRDLKPANLLLTGNMQLKVADFGFATRLRYKGELRKEMSGSINFMAPEILSKVGYSYAADLWSAGCIMYTLLVGHPPFKSASFSETYTRIKGNRYRIPSTVTTDACALIQLMLHPEPRMRPTIRAIMEHSFMTKEHLPAHLPAARGTTEQQLGSFTSTPEGTDRKPSEKH